MNDLIKKHLARMTASQKQRTLLTWAHVPVVRFGLINLGFMTVFYIPALVPDVLHWQIENFLTGGRGLVTGFCSFNFIAVAVFWRLRVYARNHPSMRHKFRKPAGERSKAAAPMR